MWLFAFDLHGCDFMESRTCEMKKYYFYIFYILYYISFLLDKQAVYHNSNTTKLLVRDVLQQLSFTPLILMLHFGFC